MWVSPNHPNPPRLSGPPREQGERLATFPRGDGEELRVNLAEYNGYPYLALRVWTAGPGGQWWPVKGKGVSIRLREVAGLAEALTAVAEWIADTRGPDRRGPTTPTPRRAALPAPTAMPPWHGTADGFDECDAEADG